MMKKLLTGFLALGSISVYSADTCSLDFYYAFDNYGYIDIECSNKENNFRVTSNEAGDLNDISHHNRRNSQDLYDATLRLVITRLSQKGYVMHTRGKDLLFVKSNKCKK